MVLLRYSLLCLSLIFSCLLNAEVYRWVDENGKVHFSDSVPEAAPAEDLSSDYHHPENKKTDNQQAIKAKLIEQYYEFREEARLEKNKPAVEESKPQASAQKTEPESFGVVVDEEVRNLLKPASTIELDFIFESQRVSEKDQARYNSLANRIYSVLQKDFSFPRGEHAVIPVRVYTEVEYYGYKARNGIKGSLTKRSYYNPSRDEIIIIKKHDADDEDMQATMLHEAVHAIVNRHMYYPSAWLNEGLAMYFEQVENYGKPVSSDFFANEIKWVKYYENKNQLMPLYSYFAVKGKSWYKYTNNRQHVYYFQGWALIAFMCSTEEGKKVLRKLISEMAQIEHYKEKFEREDLFQIIENNYPHGRKFFEHSFFRWVRSLEDKS